jgi:hypothetical protein
MRKSFESKRRKKLRTLKKQGGKKEENILMDCMSSGRMIATTRIRCSF